MLESELSKPNENECQNKDLSSLPDATLRMLAELAAEPPFTSHDVQLGNAAGHGKNVRGLTYEEALARRATGFPTIGVKGCIKLKDGTYILIIDADAPGLFDKLKIAIPRLAQTRQHLGSKPGHFLIRTDERVAGQTINMPDNTRAIDVLGLGRMAILPPSPHRKTGKPYTVINEAPLTFIPWLELKTALIDLCQRENLTWVGVTDKRAPIVRGGVCEQIKSKVTLFDFGLKPGLQSCPLPGHKNGDSHPSLSVRDDGEVFNCFSMHGGGDVFKFIQQRDGVDFKTALRALAQQAGVATPQIEIFEDDEEIIGRIDAYIRACKERRAAIDGMRIASWLAHYLASKNQFLTFEDTQEILLYSANEGIYRHDGAQFIRKRVQQIIDSGGFHRYASTHYCNEIADIIRRLTMVKRQEAEAPVNLICLQNGILDADSGTLQDFSPKYKFFSKLAVRYDPSATCPEIDKFLQTVICERTPLFYEIIGSTLHRENREQKGVVFIGEGANGKSTAISIFEAFLGSENVTSVSLQELTEDRFASANLYQKHANLVPDMSGDDLKATGTFKAATGGDIIRAQNKNCQPFFFRNFAKFIVSCNKLPKTPDDSKAFYRRLIIVPFQQSFEGSEDRGIRARITTSTELSGLLNKALAAYKKVHEAGQFSYDANSEEIRDIYIHLSDSATAFCGDRLESFSEDERGIKKSEIWFAYLHYCKEKRLLKVSEKAFWRTLPQIYEVREGRPDEGGVRVQKIFGIRWKQAIGVKDVKDFASTTRGQQHIVDIGDVKMPDMSGKSDERIMDVSEGASE